MVNHRLLIVIIIILAAVVIAAIELTSNNNATPATSTFFTTVQTSTAQNSTSQAGKISSNPLTSGEYYGIGYSSVSAHGVSTASNQLNLSLSEGQGYGICVLSGLAYNNTSNITITPTNGNYTPPCNSGMLGSGANKVAMALIQVYNVTNHVQNNARPSTSLEMNYTVSGGGSITVIAVACSGSTCAFSMPSTTCKLVQDSIYINTSAGIEVCHGQAPGRYIIKIIPRDPSTAHVSSNAFVFYG